MYKALGMYVFAGSFSIGVMNAGYKIDRVLEISDEMLEQNAKHFIYNYPDIPVIKRSEWNTDAYKEELKEEEYDLLYANPPCSGLSNINRNASADSDVNKHIYDVVRMINTIQPKSFIIENAPTLITRGKKILDYLVQVLKDNYMITIIRDYAGNHRVPMKRQRTLVVGTKVDLFPTINSFPVLYSEYEYMTVKQCLEGVEYAHSNMTLVPERSCKDLEKYYYTVKRGDSIMSTLAKSINSVLDVQVLKELGLSENRMSQILKLKEKMDNGKGAYEKSPSRLKEDIAPSLASVIEFIHPIEDRPLYIREYARLMGYPDTFEFVEDAKVPYIQAIAQGVPVNFAFWIANELRQNILNHSCISWSLDRDYKVRYLNYCNKKHIIEKYFTLEDFLNTDNICK